MREDANSHKDKNKSIFPIGKKKTTFTVGVGAGPAMPASASASPGVVGNDVMAALNVSSDYPAAGSLRRIFILVES